MIGQFLFDTMNRWRIVSKKVLESAEIFLCHLSERRIWKECCLCVEKISARLRKRVLSTKMVLSFTQMLQNSIQIRENF